MARTILIASLLQLAFVGRSLAKDHEVRRAATKRNRGEEIPKPIFSHGNFGWYATELLNPETQELPTACSRFGEKADATRTRVNGKLGYRCWLEARIGDKEERAIFEEIERDESKLPSMRLGEAGIWNKHLARLKSVCPAGMNLEYERDGLVCAKYFTKQQFCAKGTPEESSFVAGCGRTGCDPSDTDLSALTKGRYSGCFFCPVGELDLNETLIGWRRRLDYDETLIWRRPKYGETIGLGSVLCKGPAQPTPADLKKRKVMQQALE